MRRVLGASRWRWARLWVLGLAVSLAACGSDPAPCRVSSGDLVEGEVPCSAAHEVKRYVERLAARPLAASQRDALMRALAADHAADAQGAAARRDRAAAALAPLDAAKTPVGFATARGAAAWDALKGDGPYPEATQPDLHRAVKRAIAPWSTDDAQRLVLGSMDIEAWLHYASLCREAQGGGPLATSVSDRAAVYQRVRDRFDAGTPDERVAMLALGPYWASVKSRWKAAPYEAQQAWIRAAPLPAPMTGRSIEYVDAVLATPLARHVSALHEAIGPLDAGPPR